MTNFVITEKRKNAQHWSQRYSAQRAKKLIVRSHNLYRGMVHPSATNMLAMVSLIKIMYLILGMFGKAKGLDKRLDYFNEYLHKVAMFQEDLR